MDQKRKLKQILRWLPAILWMVVIFHFSSVSTDAVPGTVIGRFLILKTFHLIEYAVLFLLLVLATTMPNRSIIMAYLYSLTDEFHQSFIAGRSGRFRDTLIDLLGIFIGLIVFRLLQRLLPPRR